MNKTTVFLLFCFTCMILLTSCSGKNDNNNKIIKYTINADVETLDPQAAYSNSQKMLIMNMYEGLLRLDDSGNVIPGVAKSFEHNNDFTSFTFHLREDAVWSNEEKTKVTAPDFVYGFKRGVISNANSDLLIIKNASAILRGEESIDKLGVESVDANTFRVFLEHPCEYFEKLTLTPSLMPCNKEIFESSNNQYGLTYKNTVCNGPFKLKNKYSKVPGKSIELTANKDYKGEFTPQISGIMFTVAPITNGASDAIKSKSTDMAILSYSELKALEEENLNITTLEDSTLGLCFNLMSPEMENLNIRKGFLHALNRENILHEVTEEYLPAYNMINNNIMFTVNSYRKILNKDIYISESPDALNSLNLGLSQLNQKDIPKITVICPDSQEVKYTIGRILEAWNKKFSSYFNMKALPMNELTHEVKSGNYKIAVYPISPKNNSVSSFLSMFKSDSEDNIFGLKCENYDRIADSINTSFANEKLAKCEEAENYIIQNAIFYPLFYRRRYFVSQKNITGLIYYPYCECVDFSKAVVSK